MRETAFVRHRATCEHCRTKQYAHLSKSHLADLASRTRG